MQENNMEDLGNGIFKTIENDEEIVIVETKEGTFKLKEVAYNKINSAIKRGKPSDKQELCMLSEMIFAKDDEEKKIGEMELGMFKGSTILKLSSGMGHLVDMPNFR